VSAALAAQVAPRERSQLVVNEREQRLESGLVARPPLQEQLRDIPRALFVHGRVLRQPSRAP
jgi:hypothetical protein